MGERELTALVIDDESSVASLLVKLLNREGFKTESVHTTAEGIDKLANNYYDVVLTDLNQRPTGVDVYKLTQDKGMRAYIITGGTPNDALMNEARQTAGQYLIAKPFEIKDMIGILRRIKEQLPSQS